MKYPHCHPGQTLKRKPQGKKTRFVRPHVATCMSSSIAPSTLKIYDLPTTLIDHHHDMIYEPYRLPPIAPTNVNTRIHAGD